MRKYLLFLLIFCMFFVASCSKTEENSPYKTLEEYVALWEEQNFTEMYKLLTEKTRDQYDTEDYIDRYTKIYQDLEIDKINITYEEVDYQANATSIAVPIEVSLDSLAGNIEFSYDLQLEQTVVEEDGKEKTLWLVQWNPGLIFPELADGGKIRIEKTEPERGEILDRNEMPLAINDIAYNIGVVPEKFVNKEGEIQQIANLLHMTPETIEQKIGADWVKPSHFVPLKVLPKTEKETIQNLQSIPSVTMQDTTGRIYPSGEATAHLIGYVGKITDEEMKELDDSSYTEEDFIGKRGLEKIFEKELRGEAGIKVLVEKKNETGDPVYTTIAEKEVIHGQRIKLTIDVNLQELMYQAYEGKLKGTAAALDPNTGEVLALVSSPSFNPTPLTYGVNQGQWENLINDKQQPFVNRFAATFAPGSVLKPVFAAIGLQNGSITHEEKINIEGRTWKKSNWKDYHVTRVSTSEQPVDLEDALVRSDNIYFAMKAVEMGNKPMVDGFKKYGFEEKIPFPIPIKQSQVSNSGNLEDEVLRANTSYGQGELEVSILHLALLYSPILNDGHVVQPVLLASEPKGKYWKENVLEQGDAQKLRSYLRKVVTNGTASLLKDHKPAISGKTGTAELKLSRGTIGSENGWFVGYPTEKEDMIIAMLIEEVESLGTSSFVAKKVAHIFKEYETLQKDK